MERGLRGLQLFSSDFHDDVRTGGILSDENPVVTSRRSLGRTGLVDDEHVPARLAARDQVQIVGSGRGKQATLFAAKVEKDPAISRHYAELRKEFVPTSLPEGLDKRSCGRTQFPHGHALMWRYVRFRKDVARRTRPEATSCLLCFDSCVEDHTGYSSLS